MAYSNNILIIDEDPPENEDGMTESDRIHFGTYHGKNAYVLINDNKLWDKEYNFLKELTLVIREIKGYYLFSDVNFRLHLREYYINEFELDSFTEEKLLKLWKAIEKLIDFKAMLEMGWPHIEY